MSERVRALPTGRDGQSRWQPPSDETARLIESEVNRLVEEVEELTRAALTASRGALESVATALLERETLTLDEVDAPPVRRPRCPAGAAPASGVAFGRRPDSPFRPLACSQRSRRTSPAAGHVCRPPDSSQREPERDRGDERTGGRVQ